MLTAAAMVRSDSDLSVDSDPERSNSALRAIRNVQTEMGLEAGCGGSSSANHDSRYRFRHVCQQSHNTVEYDIGADLEEQGMGGPHSCQPVLHELLHLR